MPLYNTYKKAQLIKLWKPWKNSTGARTIAGKAKVARNAFKGGFRQQLKELNQILREQKLSLNRTDW